jgi:hypothetical protein
MYAVTDGLSGLHAGPDDPGTGHNFLVHNMCRLPGSDGTWMIAAGGMGTVARTFAAAARAAGRRSGVAVAQLVRRFNGEGLGALTPGHGGGPAVVYAGAVRDRILREFRRPPDRERDGTATWSLTTLQRALRRAPDGLPTVSTWTILQTLWEAGYTWQQNRTWCHTGTVIRRRKSGPVTVTDPDATPKKS